jgi:signal transduction histidine kinase
MIRRDKQISISRELAKKLLPVSLIICLVISFLIPGAYSYLEFSRLKNETSLYARQLSDSIRQLAAGSPGLWKYQATKYSEIIESFVPNKGIFSIAVLDDQSNPISQFSHREKTHGLFSQFAIQGKPASILFNNRKIGEIRIHLAAGSFLVKALTIFILCLVMGGSLSMLVYRMPLVGIKSLEQQLLDYQNSLEELVIQRTTALQETTEKALQLAEARRHDQEELLEAKANLEQRVEERTKELQDQVLAKEKALAELATAQSSLLELSRAAGMAEVATGVLHNVGNVLNSVNVSCNLIMNQVRESRTGNIAKVVGLIAESGADLGRFLTEDPRGRQVPAYLTSLSSVLVEEQQLILRETEALQQRIAHIKEIVTMQQSYGRVSGVLETIAPEQLMEDTLKLSAGALARHEIGVERQYRDVPPITVDKHKVLQILLNLINNAKYACAGLEKEKIITLRIFCSGSDRLSMQVSDNGRGIPSENLTRIFQHGFTTRKSGHGFGLHSGAIAAKGLGGSLIAYSDGLGLGATFTLDLPIFSGDSA